MQDCPVWGPFERKLDNVKGGMVEDLSIALLECVATDYEVMVDSSKTAWGSFSVPLHLSSRLGNDFLLVHVVRDPRAVTWSNIRTPWRPKQKSPSPPLPLITAVRTAFGWMMANLACEVLAWRHPERYIRVRYEDITHAPDGSVGAILQRVALPPPPSLLPRDSKVNRHQLHGNAMRFKSLTLAGIKEDVAWRSAMPKSLRILTSVLCWPLSRRYGYVN
jgi:hypothetical protein